MVFKLVAALVLLTVANGGILPDRTYQARTVTHEHHILAPAHDYHAIPNTAVKTVTPVLSEGGDDFEPHPQYKYGYYVEDAVSGDAKSQIEERIGDAVRGEYSFIEADGFKRTVKYTADDINGFNDFVQREPIVKAAAAVTHYADPASVVKHESPIAHTTYSLPNQHY